LGVPAYHSVGPCHLLGGLQLGQATITRIAEVNPQGGKDPKANRKSTKINEGEPRDETRKTNTGPTERKRFHPFGKTGEWEMNSADYKSLTVTEQGFNVVGRRPVGKMDPRSKIGKENCKEERSVITKWLDYRNKYTRQKNSEDEKQRNSRNRVGKGKMKSSEPSCASQSGNLSTLNVLLWGRNGKEETEKKKKKGNMGV